MHDCARQAERAAPFDKFAAPEFTFGSPRKRLMRLAYRFAEVLMSAIMIEGLTAIVVFAVILGAYKFGSSHRPSQRSNGQEQLPRQFSPPVPIMLTYCGRDGLISRQPVKIYNAYRKANGQLCLDALCGQRHNPRTFRADRIQTIETTDGEVIDTYRFLIDRLRIPANLCAGSSGQTPSNGFAKPASASHFR